MELERTRFARYSLEHGGGTLQLEWTAESADLTEQEFRAGLVRLAELVEQHRARHVLVDVRQFGYRPARDFSPWRYAEILPRYNAAGVGKFAFCVPAGATGGEPAREKPGVFPTGYFDSQEAIDEWFAARETEPLTSDYEERA